MSKKTGFIKTTLSDSIEIRFTPAQKAAIKDLSASYGMNMTDFIRYCITEVANGAVVPSET